MSSIKNVVLIESSIRHPLPGKTDNNTYLTYGYAVRWRSKQYVVAPRHQVIYSEYIRSIYKTKQGQKICTKMDILYQSVEYNLVVLVNEESDQFIPKDVTSSIGYNLSKAPELQRLDNCNYLSQDLLTESTSYIQYKYVAIAGSSIIEDQDGYVNMLLFRCEHNGTDENIANSFLVVDNSHNPVGYVRDYDTVTPISYMKHMFATMDSYREIPKHFPTTYDSIARLPFNTYSVDTGKLVINKTTLLHVAATSKKKLKQNDVITQVNNSYIDVVDGHPMLYHHKFKRWVTIETYFATSFVPTELVTLSIHRGNNDLEISCYPIMTNIMPSSSVSCIRPVYEIPYVNIGDLLVTQLTHELLLTCYDHKINIADALIDKDQTIIDNTVSLIVIDANGKNNIVPFPSYDEIVVAITEEGESANYGRPIISHIDGNKVSYLQDVKPDKVKKLTVNRKLCDYPTSTIII